MVPLIAPLLAKLRRGGARSVRAVAEPVGVSTEIATRQTARAVAEVLDRAMERGLWQHADRVAATAMRLAPSHPIVCERLARLRLMQKNAEQALAVVDSCAVHSSSLRLLRAVCLLELGRRDEAHLDLRQWATRSSAPLEARRLLALLEWQVGDTEAATQALLQNMKQISEPESLITLMMMNGAEGNVEQAATWARRLDEVRVGQGVAADGLPVDAMLQSIGVVKPAAGATPTEEQIQTLAMELMATEAVIPALVEAQRLHTQPRVVGLLIAAIERALPELEDRAAGFVALTYLHGLLGDGEAALRAAQTGVAECPMSVALVMLAKEVEKEMPAVREKAA